MDSTIYDAKRSIGQCYDCSQRDPEVVEGIAYENKLYRAGGRY